MIEGFRLSPQQMHLWSSRQTDHASHYYAQCTVLIEGTLDVETLEAALREVFARHEILRTTIVCPPGTTAPVQVIAASATLSIDHHDLRGLNASERAEALEALFQAACALPFGRGNHPPTHISLTALSAESHILAITLSAFCADIATLAIFVRELSLQYSARQRGETLRPSSTAVR